LILENQLKLVSFDENNVDIDEDLSRKEKEFN
jgi:hypothetical protein